MHQNPVIVFVCEHGAAKSVIAAAYFNKLAEEAKLDSRAIARGTHPDPELSLGAVTGLQQDGLTPAESVPQTLSLSDTAEAQRIIAFCTLPDEFQQMGIIEQWDGVPPVSTNYRQARDAILERIKKLIEALS
jgi:arsenate reductase